MEPKKTRVQLKLERLHAKQMDIKQQAQKTAAKRRAEIRQFNKADAMRIGTLMQQLGFGGIETGEIETWIKRAISVTPFPWENSPETPSTHGGENLPDVGGVSEQNQTKSRYS